MNTEEKQSKKKRFIFWLLNEKQLQYKPLSIAFFGGQFRERQLSKTSKNIRSDSLYFKIKKK